MLRSLSLFCVVLGVISMVAAPKVADARPQYLKFFYKKYPELKEPLLDQKCFTCHYGKEKTNHNDYGEALIKYFGEEAKNIKDEKKFHEGLKEVEKEKSSVEGKTFGDLIKEGKLPGTNPEKEE